MVDEGKINLFYNSVICIIFSYVLQLSKIYVSNITNKLWYGRKGFLL